MELRMMAVATRRYRNSVSVRPHHTTSGTYLLAKRDEGIFEHCTHASSTETSLRYLPKPISHAVNDEIVDRRLEL